LEARHEDVFQAAVARLATPSARYAVLYHLTRMPQKTHLTPEVLRRRQQHLVEQITDPHLLEAIAAEFDPEVALLAMAKLDSGELVRLLARNPPEPVQKAALARVTDPSALLAIAWDNPEPAIRQAAIRQITSVPVLAKAVYGGSGVKDTWALRKRLEELLEERAQARDWPAIQGVISLCWDFEEKNASCSCYRPRKSTLKICK
jgi:hypothetical protein